MEIFANHCHLLPPNSEREADTSSLLRHLDALGVSRAVVFAPFAWRMGGDLRRANTWLLEQVQDTPRLVPFATINPIHSEAIDILQMMHASGVRGCKVHPSVDIYDLTDPRAMAFYAAAAQLGILLNFHTGVHESPLALADPIKLDTILWSIPNLRLNLDHVGGRLYYETMLALAVNHGGEHPRVFLGITSVLEREENFIYCLGIERVNEMVEGLGARQLIFGLDFPWHSLEENRKALDQLRQLGIPEGEKQRLLGGTLREQIGLTA